MQKLFALRKLIYQGMGGKFVSTFFCTFFSVFGACTKSMVIFFIHDFQYPALYIIGCDMSVSMVFAALAFYFQSHFFHHRNTIAHSVTTNYLCSFQF